VVAGAFRRVAARLAGVEPLLEAGPRQDRPAWLESWNLDLNRNQGW